MAAKTKRDDFPAAVKRDLCDRVGAMCSRPDCGVLTKGPKAGSTKAKNGGRACHVHAAAPGGARFDPLQRPEDRRSFANGIWLCANCASEIDEDWRRFPAELLRTWKREAEERAQRLFCRATITTSAAAADGLIAIGPGIIFSGRILRSAACDWTVSVDTFVLGDLQTLRRYSEGFAQLEQEDCFVCVEADGVGRMLVDGPEIDSRNGITMNLHVAAPLPLHEARERHDVAQRGSDIPLVIEGDHVELDLSGRTVSGAETVAQTLMIALSVCKGGYHVGSETGSRVAEFREKLGERYAPSIIALEIIRLATVPHDDRLAKRTYVLFDFIERVRSVRMLPTVREGFLKAGITLDVYGLEGAREYEIPISTSTESLGPPPTPPSLSSFLP